MTDEAPRRRRTLNTVSAAEAARLAGVQPRVMAEHVRSGAPAPPKMRVAVAEWLPRYHEWLRQNRRRTPSGERTGGGSSQSPEEVKWRVERSKWLALRAKAHVLTEMHRLVPRKDVETRTVKQVLMVKQRLVNMCRKMGTRLMHAPSPDFIEEELLREVALICNDFARGIEPPDDESTTAAARDAGLDGAREPGVELAGPADGEPMG